MELFFAFFNIILGLFFALTGFKVIRTLDKDKEEKTLEKYGLFFKLGGIGLVLWGIIKLLM
jgi:hypothetical protein